MARTQMEQGTGRSRSKLTARQVEIARERNRRATAGNQPARSPRPSRSPSTVSPIIAIPGFGGGDQMKRNTDAIRDALGGRRARGRVAPVRPASQGISNKTVAKRRPRNTFALRRGR